MNALRSIGRKSINAFTSEEIRATESWARKFYRELGTKSPFFRAWFGDWRENDTTPVALPDIDENAQIASGRAVNADTKMQISWNKNFKNESAVHANKANRTDVDILSDNVKEIVEKSVLLDTVVSEPSSKSKLPGTAFMHSFYTLAKMRGKEALVKLYVEEVFSARTESTFARAYNLKYIEMVAGIDRGVYSSEGGLTDSHPATDLTIADLFALVKRFDKDFSPKPASKVVDEDGRPKVMYHGTGAEFWTFDRRKANDLTGRRLGLGAGRGKFYLTEHRGSANAAAYSAAQMGKGNSPRVMELYVSAQKVMDRAEYEERLQARYNNYPGSDPAGTEYDYRQRDKAIASIDRAIRKEGYDGVWDRESGEMFVFDPEQIKSATDNVGTFDAGNPDIRYSLFDETADAAQLLSENERLRRLHETFASKVGDVSRYKGKITQEAALTAARGIKRATQSKIDTDALAGSLTALREEANRQGEAGRADNEFLVQLAQNIARQVLEQSAFVDESARTLDQALPAASAGHEDQPVRRPKGRSAQGAGRPARICAGQHGAVCGSERRHSAFLPVERIEHDVSFAVRRNHQRRRHAHRLDGRLRARKTGNREPLRFQ